MKSWKRLLVLFSLLVIILLAFLGYKLFLPPSLKADEYQTARVDSGKVIMSVPAQGTVSPENEVFILSPASTLIKYIHIEPGSHVRRGEVIMVLDQQTMEDEIDRLQDQLEVMQNNLQKNRLNARNIKIDLDYNVEVKKLRIASLKSQLADQEQLLEVGGISPARFDETQQELVLAEKDLEMVLEKNSIRLEQLETDEQGLLIQISIQEKEMEAKKELLNKMIVRAPSDGIILSVSAREGEKVNQDRLLVTLSDLTSFKLVCRTEEAHAGILKTGGRIYALVDNVKLPGQIGQISPVIDEGKIEFNAYLEQSSHEVLRPNLNLDLLVVSSERDSVLRVLRGPVFGRGDVHDVFLISSGSATRQTVETGMKGAEYVEVVSGLAFGDEIIISDVASLRRINEIELRNSKHN